MDLPDFGQSPSIILTASIFTAQPLQARHVMKVHLKMLTLHRFNGCIYSSFYAPYPQLSVLCVCVQQTLLVHVRGLQYSFVFIGTYSKKKNTPS